MQQDITVCSGSPALRSAVHVCDQGNQAAGWIRAARTEWRELTGGADTPDALRPTLVAVSGGADSAALAIALGTLEGPRVVLASILHDQRPAELVHDDRAAVASLANRLGVRMVNSHTTSRDGNAEHAARTARYTALDRIATQHGCDFIVTAHHAYDQAETLIMALCRGASPDALLGVRRARPSATPGITIVRPALKLSPSGAHDVCRDYGYEARTDATNRDPARARTRIRQGVVPTLEGATDNLGAQLASTIARLEERLAPEHDLGLLLAKQAADLGLERIKTR